MMNQQTESPETIEATTRQIAGDLNETQTAPMEQIKRIIEVLGSETALRLLGQTKEVESQGGLTIADGSRRRTIGGVFFYYARRQMKADERRYVWPDMNKPVETPFNWEDRLALVPQLRSKLGEARTAKITLIGRPGRVVIKGEIVLTSIANTRKAPPLPRGLPTPPDDQPPYIVYVSDKQWRKVASSIKNPTDSLIVEGYPVFDQRLKAMAVFATNITTKLLQRGRREEQSQTEKRTGRPAQRKS
jgi:hypothetical protein